MAFVIFFSFPLMAHPCTNTIDDLIFKGRKFSWIRRSIIVLGIVGLALLIATTVADVSFIFSLTGATASTAIGFILPAAFFIKLAPGKTFVRHPLGLPPLAANPMLLPVQGQGWIAYSLYHWRRLHGRLDGRDDRRRGQLGRGHRRADPLAHADPGHLVSFLLNESFFFRSLSNGAFSHCCCRRGRSRIEGQNRKKQKRVFFVVNKGHQLDL